MPIKIGNITVYTIKELSETLGVTHITLRSYIRQGKLQGQKVGGKWVVTEDNLKEFLNGLPRSPGTKE